jgi:hypothetical protein
MAILASAAASGPESAAAAAGSAARATAGRMLFGLGPEADGARRSRLAASTRIRMLSSWYNGPADLGWMTGWRSTEVRRDYAAGYALHLIVWASGPHATVATRYGSACGETYPLSPGFLKDMERLARTFRAPPGARLYVTLFSEFQTYACHGNDWAGEPQTTAYFRALEDQYRRALGIFHRLAPHSAVSLGWGGWQTRWDAPGTGGGRSLFEHFSDVMKHSDFESFEVIGSTSAASDILGMTAALNRFGPVMLGYYKPTEDAGGRAQLQTVLSGRFLTRLIRARMFALSFMNDSFLSGDPASLAIVSEAAARFGCGQCGPTR